MGADGGTLTLGEGTSVLVRRVRAGDAAALQRLVGRSSDRSIELRFLGPLKQLSDGMARRFADVDGKDRFALVALDPENPDEIVGVVRYAREGADVGAEYAALIEDRFQGRGLGIGLTRYLIEAARERERHRSPVRAGHAGERADAGLAAKPGSPRTHSLAKRHRTRGDRPGRLVSSSARTNVRHAEVSRETPEEPYLEVR